MKCENAASIERKMPLRCPNVPHPPIIMPPGYGSMTTQLIRAIFRAQSLGLRIRYFQLING